MKKIGILGGTFNPIHLGHLAMARAALNTFKLDRVYFVPCAMPPHKSENNLAPAKDRLQMVKRAIKGNPKFRISNFEIRKGGRSYSIDTVKHFRSKLKSKDQLFFIIGQDSLNTLGTWKQIDELTQLVQFVVINRRGSKKIKSKYKVLFVEMPALNISSSGIRNKLNKGRTVKNFVPERVRQYIEKKNLYDK